MFQNRKDVNLYYCSFLFCSENNSNCVYDVQQYYVVSNYDIYLYLAICNFVILL